MSSKADLFAHVRQQLRTQLERLEGAARDAHAAATDPDSKAESKYDTRSLEASYLAAGQARQLEELAEDLRLLDHFEPVDFEIDSTVASGALVEVMKDGDSEYFLLAPAAGGLTVRHFDREITLLTPSSRLYQSLTGGAVGTVVTDQGHTIMEIE